MKAVSRGQNLEEFHQKCVCQICSCQKHHCPHSKVKTKISRCIYPIRKSHLTRNNIHATLSTPGKNLLLKVHIFLFRSQAICSIPLHQLEVQGRFPRSQTPNERKNSPQSQKLKQKRGIQCYFRVFQIIRSQKRS